MIKIRILVLVLRGFIPIGMLIWAFYSPELATYIYLSITIVIEGYLFIIDYLKPEPDANKWSAEEIEIIKKYHIVLRYPSTSIKLSGLLDVFRLSAMVWIPFTIWKNLWVGSIFFFINYIIANSIIVKLDPFFYLPDRIGRGATHLKKELSVFVSVNKKIWHPDGA